MSKIEFLGGSDDVLRIEDTIVKAILDGEASIGDDIDGTLAHTPPGEHKNVTPDHNLVRLFNGLYDLTKGQAFMLTGRPFEFGKNFLPGRRFLLGTEHGTNISKQDGMLPFNRIGNPKTIIAFKAAFECARAIDPLLQGVEIEDYKDVTATLGFTHVINPEGKAEIDRESLDRMTQISLRIVETARKISKDLNAHDMQVVDTVTPTNAVVEYIPQGACKAESLQYLRDVGLVRKARVNVFGGDSSGDRTVMEKVFNEVGGICLGVGPKAPQASHVVFATPEGHVAFLNRIESAVRERQSALSMA